MNDVESRTIDALALTVPVVKFEKTKAEKRSL